MKPFFRFLSMPGCLGVAALPGVLVALLLWPAPSPADDQETTLTQTNPASVDTWVPIISNFYMVSGQTLRGVSEEGAMAVAFDRDDLINPKPHFALNPPRADETPTIPILTDWRVLQERLRNGEPASAWLVKFEMGKPRLFVHRVSEEEYLVGYRENVRYPILLRLDIPHERLPGLRGLSGSARRQKLLQNIKVVNSTLKISRLNGVALRGRGGTPVEPPELTTALPIQTLEQFLNPEFVLNVEVEYIPRFETTQKGDKLDGVVNVAVTLVLEVGPELGINPPEQKTVQGEIRMAIGKEYINIDVLSRQRQRK